MDRHPGPPMHEIVLMQLHADPSKFRDHPTKIQILVEDIMAMRESLRSIAVLHEGTHYCGSAERPPFLWPAGTTPCPTMLIAECTLSGYLRGGRWPYGEEDT